VLNDTADIQDESRDLIAAFLRGEPVELHQLMAASEEAAISLQLLVELRNKLTDAYRTVMNMQ
jgi:flagellar hook-basal body complex protein FliE